MFLQPSDLSDEVRVEIKIVSKSANSIQIKHGNTLGNNKLSL
jgi:hypothetical protein